MDDFLKFTSPENHCRFGYESTCGAGTPFIAALHRISRAGDVVRSIEGTFSGTLGFITSGLDDGRKVIIGPPRLLLMGLEKDVINKLR